MPDAKLTNNSNKITDGSTLRVLGGGGVGGRRREAHGLAFICPKISHFQKEKQDGGAEESRDNNGPVSAQARLRPRGREEQRRPCPLGSITANRRDPWIKEGERRQRCGQTGLQHSRDDVRGNKHTCPMNHYRRKFRNGLTSLTPLSSPRRWRSTVRAVCQADF